ncbi:MAG: sugar phosphate isomerase/epimerase family protein [Candidatus Cyclobacteriaceae bacterium M3_2C_046]
MKYTRKDFIRLSGMALATSSAITWTGVQAAEKEAGKTKKFNLGVASYTFRKFDLDKTIECVNRLGVHNLALKSMHMPLDSSAAQIRKMADQVRKSGLNLYGAGVIYMKSREQVDQAFDYAKNADLKLIIGVPNPELLPYVNDKVKNYDIKVAIHNHGPGDDLYPSPNSVMEKVQEFDQRIGLCMDIGHTVRIKEDPAQLAKKYIDRLHDVHIKDVTADNPDGETLQIGRGIIDIPGFLTTLDDIGYTGVVSLEYEKDGDDPLPGSAESIGYLNGIIKMM